MLRPWLAQEIQIVVIAVWSAGRWKMADSVVDCLVDIVVDIVKREQNESIEIFET